MAWNWDSLPGSESIWDPITIEQTRRLPVNPERLNIVGVTRSFNRKTVEFRVYDPVTRSYTDIEVTDYIFRTNSHVHRLVQEHAASIFDTQAGEVNWKKRNLLDNAVRKLGELRRVVPMSVPTKEAHEAAVADAKSAGMEIIMGRPDLLLIDFDGGVPPDFMKYLPLINETYGVVEQQSWLSKSGYPHIHVKIVMRTPIPAVERIALQALLGSDPLRELITLQRIRNGEEEPSCLFRPSRVNEVPTLQTINILDQLLAAGKPTP